MASECMSREFLGRKPCEDGQQKAGITRRKVLIAAVTATPALALMADTADSKDTTSWGEISKRAEGRKAMFGL